MILDTNAISDLAARNPNLIDILQGVPRVGLPVIAVGEYLYGVQLSRFGKTLEPWLRALVKANDLLNVDEATLPHYAQLRRHCRRVGRPIPANDLWIAALVRQYERPLLSCDKHFDDLLGVERISWSR